jgi:hypothetical protein
MTRTNNFINHKRIKGLGIVLLLTGALAGIGCGQPNQKDQNQQAAAAVSPERVHTAASTTPSAAYQATQAKAAVKPSCCKGAPSRNRLTAQLKKKP